MPDRPLDPQGSAVPPDADARGSKRAKRPVSVHRSALLGAMFLMATSAIGPGFITQTATFTVKLGAAFAFAILISILVDIAVQLNVWRVIGVSGMRAQELANRLLPGAGVVLSALVFLGGLVFNIGNIAGTGLGMNTMLGVDAKIGGLVSAGIAVAIFLVKRAGAAMDRIVVVLGGLMIALMIYVAVVANPPVGEALRQTVMPDQIDILAITTLVGGTVGGYITYAGAHRMVDSGVRGPEAVREITNTSVLGIIVTGIMRVLLFLAILGVVHSGAQLDPDNLAASAFFHAAGEIGMRLFGIVLWAAAITSVIGASYTSVSFLTKTDGDPRRRNLLTVAFIAVCAVVYMILGQAPQTLLVFAGAFNALILPIGFAILLWVAIARRDLLSGYRYPVVLLVIGFVAWLITLFLAWNSFRPMFAMLGVEI